MAGNNSKVGITRKEFVRKAVVGVAAVGAVAIGKSGMARAHGELPQPHGTHVTRPDGTPAAPGDQEMWIYPYQNPDDLEHVKWAIENVAVGGTVLLKAKTKGGQPKAFDFGAYAAFVYKIKKDLHLCGEALTRNVPEVPGTAGGWIESGTTIIGGTLQLGEYITDGGESPGPSVTVRDILFTQIVGDGIVVHGCSGYNEISGCAFTKFASGSVPGYPVVGAFPIVIHGGPIKENIENVTGTYKVKNNFIGQAVNAVTGAPVDRINNLMHFTNCRLELEISENEVEDACWAGFVIALNMGHTIVARNRINKTRSFAQPGAAIAVGWYPLNAIFKTNSAYEGGVDVVDNVITIGSQESASSTVNTNAIVLTNYPYNQFSGQGLIPDVRQIPSPPSQFTVSGNRIKMYRNLSNNILNPAAISLNAAANNVTCANNIVEGEAIYGMLVTSKPFGSQAPPVAPATLTNNGVYQNNFKGFRAGLSQLFLELSTQNEFKNNDYGPSGSYDADGAFHHGLAGAYIRASNNNTFVNENFWGPYTGTMDMQGNPVFPPFPCLWFAAGSSGNTVSALKNGQALQGFDICTQIFFAVGSANNDVNGYSKCGAVPQTVITAMMAREAEFVQKQKDRCLAEGGVLVEDPDTGEWYCSYE